MLRAVLEASERLDGFSFAQPAQIAEATSPQSSAPLGQAIHDFMDEHSRQWPKKTEKQVLAYLNILIEHFGSERLLGAISKQDASEIKKVLQALPASRNTKPALKALPLSEVIKVKGHKRISPKTINSHIDTFRRFFDWAERHGHSPHKLFEGMKVPKAKNAATERKPFSKAQTALIFNELTQNPSGLVRKESHKWASLLGLFTGARLNEICQLETADVQCQGDIWFLDITDEGDSMKRVKAAASRRKVPLHSELIKAGFLDFLQSRGSHQRLFSDFNYSPNGGYGRSLGRWFNTTFLSKLGIKQAGLVFHCLRHTVVDRLSDADVPEPILQYYVGHARSGVTQEVYNRSGFTLEQLKNAIDRFEV
jgi:integrase